MADGPPENGNGKRTLISRESLVPIGLASAIVVAVCGSVLGTYTWLDDRLDGIAVSLTTIKNEQQSANASINSSLESVRDDVGSMERVLSDRITKSEFQTWVELLLAKNPTLTRP